MSKLKGARTFRLRERNATDPFHVTRVGTVSQAPQVYSAGRALACPRAVLSVRNLLGHLLGER